MHTNCIHATLTQTHAPTHARNTHTYTRSHARTQHSHAHTHACMHTPVHHTTNTHSHAQVLNLHVHAHTSGPDRHIHNQVIPVHGVESCRACVNLCLSDLFPMRTDRWVGPTRNVVNLTSQHGATQTIWPVNRVQSNAEL